MSYRTTRTLGIRECVSVLVLCTALLLPAIAPSSAGASAPLASITRMIGFEPHPSMIDVPGSFLLRGAPVTASIELLETWNAERDVPSLDKLGFRLRLTSPDGQTSTVEIQPLELNAKKLTPGSVLAAGAGDTAGLTIVLHEFTKQGSHVTGLTLDFAIRATGEELQPTPQAASGLPASATAAPPVTPVTASTPSGTAKAAQLAGALMSRADAMPATAVTGKRLLYRKAILALDTAPAASVNEALRAEITAKLDALGSTGAPPTAQAPSEPASLSLSMPPVDASPAAMTASTPSVTPAPATTTQAQDLYQQALKAFDRQEEPAARDFLRRATEADPNHFESWLLLGKNAVANSKFARAKEALERALAIRPDDTEAGALYFKSTYYLGEGETGIEKLTAMAARHPEAFAPRMVLAEALYQFGDLPRCEEECLALLDRFPGNDRAKELLSRTRTRMK
ncbi:MAG TPA: tetratricopeptide repeat protein [Candidatus Ozemobacteraceae bacterium]